MMRALALVAIALLLTYVGCDSAPTTENATVILESEDPRFRIMLEHPQMTSTLSAPNKSLLQFHLRIQPKSGWHIEPNAPTHLGITSSPTLGRGTAGQTGEFGVEVVASKQLIDFSVASRHLAEGRSTKPDYAIDAHLTFGVCREGNLRCEIVNRDLRIPLR